MTNALHISGSGSAWFGGGAPLIGRRIRNACLALGLVLSHTAALDGRTYESVFFSGSFNFDAGSVIVPDIPCVLFGTFMFTGTLAGFADPSLTGTPLFSTDLTGGGSRPLAVRVAFSNSSVTPGVRVDQIDYRFDNAAPVPEPGSLLLFGSGTAWVAARCRKRRHGDRLRGSAVFCSLR